MQQTRIEKGYNVKVRERGKWVQANEQPVSRDTAESIGSYVADHSAAASFKIKPTNKYIEVNPSRSQYYRFNKQKFRSQKKNSKIRVERNLHRIDTPGELMGITAQGLIAQMKKRNQMGIKGKSPVKKPTLKKTTKKPQQRQNPLMNQILGRR